MGSSTPEGERRNAKIWPRVVFFATFIPTPPHQNTQSPYTTLLDSLSCDPKARAVGTGSPLKTCASAPTGPPAPSLQYLVTWRACSQLIKISISIYLLLEQWLTHGGSIPIHYHLHVHLKKERFGGTVSFAVPTWMPLLFRIVCLQLQEDFFSSWFDC